METVRVVETEPFAGGVKELDSKVPVILGYGEGRFKVTGRLKPCKEVTVTV